MRGTDYERPRRAPSWHIFRHREPPHLQGETYVSPVIRTGQVGRIVGPARYLPATLLARDSVGEWVAVAAGTSLVGGAAVYGATRTDDTGPILAFAAAVLVALITAFTTNRRQQHALEAESERQRRALDAESERLRLQLAHDREMADLGDTRELLDDAAVALHDADYARYEVEKARMTHGTYVGERAPDVVGELGEAGKSLDR